MTENPYKSPQGVERTPRRRIWLWIALPALALFLIFVVCTLAGLLFWVKAGSSVAPVAVPARLEP